MVPTTVFVEGSITETVLLPKFVTYIFPLSGLKAIYNGSEFAVESNHNVEI